MDCQVIPFAAHRHHGQVVALWREVFGYTEPRNDPATAITKKLAQPDGLFLVAAQDETVVGTVMVGYDGHRGWIYALAVAGPQQRAGVGTALMRAAEEALKQRGCLKINLQVLPENAAATAFYRSLGYAVEDRISMGKEIPENIRPERIDDPELLRRFEDCSYPFAAWTHRTHVKIAFLYLRENGFATALEKFRRGIKAYNAANQVPEEQFSGYNETTTHAFLHLVDVTMRAYGRLFPTPDADTFCDTHPQLLSKHVLRLFYSPERRSQPEAKTALVPPDLTALPQAP